MSGIRGPWGGHFVKKCSCGKIIAQCRCPDPSKRVEVVERGCEECKKEKK